MSQCPAGWQSGGAFPVGTRPEDEKLDGLAGAEGFQVCFGQCVQEESYSTQGDVMTPPGDKGCTPRGKWTAARDAARRQNIAKAQEATRTLPKCGAKKRGSEERCQNVALENGRCRLHGGLTPKGDQWHRIQWGGVISSPRKLARKMDELRVRQQRLEARLAAMTPDEREAYDRISRLRKPGTPAERLAARQGREARKWLQRLSAADRGAEKALTEADRIQAAIDALEAQAARLQSPPPEDDVPEIFK